MDLNRRLANSLAHATAVRLPLTDLKPCGLEGHHAARAHPVQGGDLAGRRTHLRVDHARETGQRVIALEVAAARKSTSARFRPPRSTAHLTARAAISALENNGVLLRVDRVVARLDSVLFQDAAHAHVTASR